jgi:glycosyltransferase involved in cell wall biosynthesis
MPATFPIGTVAIPAHNEAGTITRCLDSLLEGARPGEIEVLVACNGCTDGTADVVRSSPHDVRVIEVAEASKIAALRAADEALAGFPRLYLDADVIIPAQSARQVLDRLSRGPALAARPPIEYDTAGATALVRSYYRARSRVPAVMNSLWGAGVYGLSAEGRARFGEFPDLVGDDLFVDQQFQRGEIEVVDCPPVIVKVPRRTADLFRILRRYYRGNKENRALGDGSASTSKGTMRDLRISASSSPDKAFDAAAYAAFAATARLSLAVAAPTGWARDESSRG